MLINFRCNPRFYNTHSFCHSIELKKNGGRVLTLAIANFHPVFSLIFLNRVNLQEKILLVCG